MKNKIVPLDEKNFWDKGTSFDKIYREKDIKTAVQNLLTFIKKKNSFHFDQIQKILDKKAEGNISLDLDVLYKIHNNSHQECVEIMREITKDFGKSFTETNEVEE